MSYGGVYGGDIEHAYTGRNLEGRTIVLAKGNTQDSVATSDPTLFVQALTNVQLLPPVVGYLDDDWAVIPNEMKLQYVGSQDRDIQVVASGWVTSDSGLDTNRIVTRLLATSGVLTGTTKHYPAGKLVGAETSRIGFTMIGYDRLTTGNFVGMQLSKTFPGTLVVQELIMVVTPLW